MKRSKTAHRNTAKRKIRNTISANQVQEMLLELTYRLHSTKRVAALPRVAGSVA